MKSVLKFVYDSLPLKIEFFKLLRLFWQPSEPVYKHLHSKGLFDVSYQGRKLFKMQHYGFQLENEIFWSGLDAGWEKNSIKLWIDLCKQSTCILDIGANTGIYSLIAKAVNPSSKIYAFEPVMRVYEKLVANIKLNNFDIYTEKKAASNKNGLAIIYDTATEHVYSVTVNKNLTPAGTPVSEVEIETIQLDTFIAHKNIEKVDLLKIDVETHEPEILEGFKVGLRQNQPTMLIEVLNDQIGSNIETLINGLDYLYFNIDEKNGVKQVESITKSDSYNYLLCSKKTAKSINLI